MDEKLLKPKKLCEMIGVQEKTLTEWRRLKKGPKFIRKGKKFIRYRIEDVNEWLTSKTSCDDK